MNTSSPPVDPVKTAYRISPTIIGGGGATSSSRRGRRQERREEEEERLSFVLTICAAALERKGEREKKEGFDTFFLGASNAPFVERANPPSERGASKVSQSVVHDQ